MQPLQAHCKPLSTPGRRLTAQTSLTFCYQSLFHCRGANTRLSRLNAAETVGSGVDRLHDVRRRSLKQSFELDGTAPEGHPDNSLATAVTAAAPDVDSSWHRSQAGQRPASHISSSRHSRSSRTINGNGTAAAAAAPGVVRRLGNPRSRSATSRRSSTSTSTASIEAVPTVTGTEEAAPVTAAAFHHVSVTPQQQQQQEQEVEIPQADVGSDDPDSDRELQAEFHESQCCQDVLDIIDDELNRFSPFHTVTALNRLSKLGRSLPWQERSAVLKDTNFILLLDRLVRQAPLLNPFQLSTSLYSCAVLQVPLFSLKTGTISLLLPALESAISAQLKQFNDRDISSTLYAYAQLRPHTAVDVQRKQLSYNMVSQLAGQAHSLVVKREMSGQSVSMVLWSLATLHSSSSSSGIAAGSSAIVAAATEQLLQDSMSFDLLGSQVVANSIWAAEKLGHHNLQLLQKGCDWMAHNPQKCKVQEVLNVLWAAGAARYRPKMLGTLAKHIAGQSKVLKPADVASLFHVLGIFGFDFELPANKPILQALLPRAADLLPHMKPSEVTSLYWGLGMTKQVHNSLFQQLTTVVGKLQQQAAAASGQRKQQTQRPEQQPRTVQLPASLQRQAFQAYIAAKLEEAEDVNLPGDVVAALRSAWLEGSSSGGSSSGKRKQQQLRPMLEELQWMLQALRVKAKVNGRSKLDGLVTVDIELTASGQRSVAVQILDEHDVDSQGHRLAPVLWEEDLLHKNGYEQVYWLQVSDYKRCPLEKRPRFLADVLKRVGVNAQERLVAAAEKAWVSAGCKVSAAGAGAAAAAGGWGMVGASGIRASEVDVLMQGAGGQPGGGYAAGGGRGSRRSDSRRRR